MREDLKAGRPVGKVYSANLGREITVYAREGETDEEALRRVKRRHLQDEKSAKRDVSSASDYPKADPDQVSESSSSDVEEDDE